MLPHFNIFHFYEHILKFFLSFSMFQYTQRNSMLFAVYSVFILGNFMRSLQTVNMKYR